MSNIYNAKEAGQALLDNRIIITQAPGTEGRHAIERTIAGQKSSTAGRNLYFLLGWLK